MFFSNKTGEKTHVESLNETYFIDYNNDSTWDYSINSSTYQIINYLKGSTNDPEQPGFVFSIGPNEIIIISIILAIIIIANFLIKPKPKRNKVYYVKEIKEEKKSNKDEKIKYDDDKRNRR